MEETGLENMTENIEKEKVLSKEAIVAALNERHSPEKQKLLSAGRVAIAGLGGLGSNVAYALARIGVGHLHLIDFDVVDITNLNRQQYFMEHIGMYKTDALKSLLLKINPYLDNHLSPQTRFLHFDLHRQSPDRKQNLMTQNPSVPCLFFLLHSLCDQSSSFIPLVRYSSNLISL